MKKALQLMGILTEDYTVVIDKKYALAIVQVATLEDRIKSMMSFGLVDKGEELERELIMLLTAVRDEYKEDEKDKKRHRGRGGKKR